MQLNQLIEWWPMDLQWLPRPSGRCALFWKINFKMMLNQLPHWFSMTFSQYTFHVIAASESFFFEIAWLVPLITCAWTTLMLVQEGNWTCSIFFHLCMVLVLGLEWARVGVLHPGCHLSELFTHKICMDCHGLPTVERIKKVKFNPGRLFNDADHLRPLPSQLRWVWPWAAKGGGTSGPLLFVRVQCHPNLFHMFDLFWLFPIQEIQPEDGKIVDVWWHIGIDDFDTLRWVKTPWKCRCLKRLRTAQTIKSDLITSLWSKLSNLSEL